MSFLFRRPIHVITTIIIIVRKLRLHIVGKHTHGPSMIHVCASVIIQVRFGDIGMTTEGHWMKLTVFETVR